ncbi:hypothetical protein BJ165DRAFT_1524483 [Panaeolus papilionaceus]|nr:hypothetical protein BJ165DRAFT_1524483 [Panaeolus papilionaceus]
MSFFANWFPDNGPKCLMWTGMCSSSPVRDMQRYRLELPVSNKRVHAQLCGVALEGQCKANGVDVALTPRPPDPPRTQTGTWTIPIPQSSTSTPSPDISISPSPSPTSQSPPVSQILTPVVTSTPRSTNRAATTSATSSPTTTPTPPATAPGSITTSSTTPSGSNVIGPDLTIGSTGQETSKSASSVPIIAGVVSGAGVLLISVVVFFLLYTRRLKRNQHKAPSSEFRQSTSANTSPPSQTLWGQPLLSPNRRLSINSSQHTTSPAMEQVGFMSSTSKGWSGPSRDPVMPLSDSSSLSDIYVRHEDSGLVLSPDGRAVVELPPDYRNLRNPNG